MNPVPDCILAATDFSSASREATRRAARLAAAHGARLLLVHALAPPSWSGEDLGGLPRPDFESLRHAVDQALAAEREALLALHADIGIAVLDGAPHHSIPVFAEASAAGLVVLAARGAGGGVPRLAGSTADRLVRRLRIPVLVVRRAADAPWRKLGLATDFSPASEAAARLALALAPAAQPLLVHVDERLFEPTLAFAGASPQTMEDYRQRSSRQAMADLQALAARLGDDGRRLVPALRSGRASREIADLVGEAGIDLLVLGHPGRSALELALLGSIGRFALDALDCDLLLAGGDPGA